MERPAWPDIREEKEVGGIGEFVLALAVGLVILVLFLAVI